MSDAIDTLEERRKTWKSKEVLRKLYLKWYKYIAEALKPGKVLELGGGSGNLKEFFPKTLSTDVVYAPWLDAVLDAHNLPFKFESMDSIVLFDVLHHLQAPALFFHEAERILRPGGKIILMEPYVSWASYFIYRFFHQEGMRWQVNPLKRDHPSKDKNPFSGNQAIPTLLFEKHIGRFVENFPRFRVLKMEKVDSLIYPLSGGFHHPSVCPVFLKSSLETLEKLLRPLNSILAFRLFAVIQKV